MRELVRSPERVESSISRRGVWRFHSILVLIFGSLATLSASALPAESPQVIAESKGDLPQVFKGHDEYVYTISFSGDGKTMATAAGDNRAIIWNAAKCEPLHELAYDAAVYAAAVSPDGKLVATASGEGDVDLWDVVTGKKIVHRHRHQDAVYGLAFSPDGKFLASAGGSTNGGDTTCRIWKVAEMTVSKELVGHERQIYGVAFSPDGQTIATGSSDKTIRLWNVASGEFSTLRGHSSDVYRCEFSPDGTKLASASQDGTVRLWTLKSATAEIIFAGKRKEAVYGVAFSKDGSSLCATGDDYRCRLWRTSDRRLEMDEKVSRKSLYAVAISPNQQQLFVAGEDGDIYRFAMPKRYTRRENAN